MHRWHPVEDKSVKTGVDALLELLKQNEKIALADAAKSLQMPEKTVKLWVDFLVEEKLIGIEYKFTKPYIYLNKKQDNNKGKIVAEEQITIKTFKQAFEQRAGKSNIPEPQVNYLWRDHLLSQADQERPFFFREARKRGLDDIDDLWNAYKEQLIED